MKYKTKKSREVEIELLYSKLQVDDCNAYC